MNTKPILFSCDMIRTLLAGTKSQTRRVVKPQPQCADGWTSLRYFGKGLAIECGPDYPDDASDRRLCPYGQEGGLLWVREAWAAIHVSVDPETGIGEDVHGSHDIPPGPGNYWQAVYAADPVHEPSREDRGFAWRPSIFMPRWASRITLQITDVRVQRVQDISEADARAEGCEHPLKGTELEGMPGDFVADERTSFAILWDSINKKRGYGWSGNPWVWCISFRPILANVNDVLADPGRYGVAA